MTFKTILPATALAASLTAGLTAPASAHHHTRAVEGVTIVVSCFRGPWEDVIWDRPNPVFVDSLVTAGYSFPEAHAIAERVCRDPDTVGDHDGMRRVMEGILANTPPAR
jgi:hypothetical protein